YHGEPLSPDRVFDFPKDELESHPAYDFFTPAPLLGYAGNPNNNSGWLTADDYLLGELEAMVIALVADMEEGQMDVSMIDMEEDLSVLFGEDDDFENDSKGVDEEEAWEVNEKWLMAPVTPPPLPAVQPPSVYKVGVPSTTRVNQVSDAEVAAGVTIGELGPRIYAIEGQVQRDMQFQKLQTTVTEMGSRESTLMRCILRLERQIAALEKRPPGP
nr:hypothetical protein [Tanacetum cinerariifolium]